MAYQRYCASCGKDVVCREEQRAVQDSDRASIHLFCPSCDRRLATVYGSIA